MKALRQLRVMACTDQASAAVVSKVVRVEMASLGRGLEVEIKG